MGSRLNLVTKQCFTQSTPTSQANTPSCKRHVGNTEAASKIHPAPLRENGALTCARLVEGERGQVGEGGLTAVGANMRSSAHEVTSWSKIRDKKRASWKRSMASEQRAAREQCTV